MSFIVAIDGPAGTGKGTITKLIANEMNLINIDTGATYRAITLAMLRKNVKLDEFEKIQEILESSKIEFRNLQGEQCIFLNDENISKEIRSKEVTSLVSQVSAITIVRYAMADLQREMAEGKNVIMEGRDIGTYVFPNASVKIYLDANVEERAKRRYLENQQKGINMTFEEVLNNIKMRDENDKSKAIGALKVADDAIIVDTTPLTIQQVKEKVKGIIIKSL